MKHLGVCVLLVGVACGSGQPEPAAPTKGQSRSTEVAVTEPASALSDAGAPEAQPPAPQTPAVATVEPGPEDCWAVGDVRDVPSETGKDVRALTFDEPWCGDELDEVVTVDFGDPAAVQARINEVRRRLQQPRSKAGGRHKRLLRCRTENSWTLLHISAMQGNRGVSEVLIANGADVRACDMNGATPLHYAARDGHAAVVELLLDRGAYVDAVDIGGSRPLHEAVELFPLESPRPDTDARERHAAFLRVIELLINHGATLDLPDAKGNTALHVAASNGNLELVQLLVEKGASVRVKDAQGRTPQDVAASPEVANWLRERMRASE